MDTLVRRNLIEPRRQLDDNDDVGKKCLKLGLALTLGLSGASAYSTESMGTDAICRAVMLRHLASPEPSIEEEYRRILSDPKSTQSEKNHSVSLLLERAFLPMLDGLALAVQDLSPKQVEQKVAQYRLYEVPARGYATMFAKHSDSTVMDVEATDSPALRGIQEVAQMNSLRFINLNHGVYTQLADAQSAILVDPTLKTPENLIEVFRSAPTLVGPEGRRTAVARAITTRILEDLVLERTNGISDLLWAENKGFLGKETMRGRGAARAERPGSKPSPDPPPVAPPAQAMMEGIDTFNRFLNSVLGSPVPGAQDGKDAIRRIIFDGKQPGGVVTDFTRRVPMGWVGPWTLAMKRLKSSIIRTPDGKLDLSASVKELLQPTRSKEIAKEEKPGQRGICPFAVLFRKNVQPASIDPTAKSGLEALSHLYWKVFEMVDQALDVYTPPIKSVPTPPEPVH